MEEEMQLEGTPSYPVNCSNFTSLQFWYLDLARGVSGTASLLICSLILFLLLLHKAYASPLQRFLLYLTLTTWLTEASFTAQIEHLVKYAGQSYVCQAVGFFDQFCTSLFIMFSLELSLLLLFQVYKSLHIRYIPWPLWTNHFALLLEVIAILLSLAYSIAVSVVPFAHGTYGLSGSWCWIQAVKSNCEKSITNDQNTLAVIPYAVLGAIIGLCMLLTLVLFCIAACYSTNSPQLNCKLIRDNAILLIFYLVFLGVCVVDVSIGLKFTNFYEDYTAWFIFTAGFPVAELVLPLGFMFYMYTVKKLTHESVNIIKNTFAKCCQKKKRLHYTKIEGTTEKCRDVTGAASFPSSHPQSYPSETVYSVYTGAFSSTQRSSSGDCHPSLQTERQPLLSHTDTGCRYTIDFNKK